MNRGGGEGFKLPATSMECEYEYSDEYEFVFDEWHVYLLMCVHRFIKNLIGF